MNIQLVLEALKASKESLEDWIQTTGFGEINRRDKKALALVTEAIVEIVWRHK